MAQNEQGLTEVSIVDLSELVSKSPNRDVLDAITAHLDFVESLSKIAKDRMVQSYQT